MNLIVPEEVLMTYKDIVDNYACHDVHCAYHMTEFCDCGLGDKIRRLIELSKETMKLRPISQEEVERANREG